LSPDWDRIFVWIILHSEEVQALFTGIVEEMGTVQRLDRTPVSCQLTISASIVLQDTKIGDSIAVNGVCLTVTDLQKNAFTADVMPETLRRSSLGSLRNGSLVNLERAMAANGRFGGHIVSGHIDGTGKIASIVPERNAKIVTISAPPSLLHYIVEKGSIAIDGISLTVTNVTKSDFCVSLIPHTGTCTTLLSKRAGEVVNLETDVIGKYVEKLMQPVQPELTASMLKQYGF
jgi:riboflavin synthase